MSSLSLGMLKQKSGISQRDSGLDALEGPALEWWRFQLRLGPTM